MEENRQITEFITTLAWEQLPADVQRRAKICLLDNLGATLGGTLTPVGRLTAEYAALTWAGDEATILLQDAHARAPGAAFANAWAANGLDIDDDAIFTRGHPGAQLFPAALAAAEQVGAGGAALLTATVIGYEIAIRVGRCWHDHHTIYQADGSWGAVACAATAAHLLRLDPAATAHALGIAEYFAPNAPMMRDIDHPTMVKHAIGWGAMTGVTAAELAQRGFTGVPSILGFEAYRDWVADLGEKYWMTDWVFYKAWASCAWGHPACVAAQTLIREHDLALEEIARIEVRAFEEAVELYQGYPTTTEEAQFSVVWPLACLLLDGEIGPDQILEHRFTDPEVRALVDKIEVVLDPEVDALYDSMQEMDLRMHSAVEITLEDGRTFDSGVVERGADQWDAAALERKFRWLVGHVLEPARVDELVDMVWDFETLPDVRALTRLLTGGGPSEKGKR
jgi:2-methylcitrate dehydratase PrpD